MLRFTRGLPLGVCPAFRPTFCVGSGGQADELEQPLLAYSQSLTVQEIHTLLSLLVMSGMHISSGVVPLYIYDKRSHQYSPT